MPHRPVIAQCLEYPINAFGGVEVLVKNLVEGLADRFKIILVSDDQSRELENSPIGSRIEGHIPTPKFQSSAAEYRELAENLANRGVELAHFHSGTYGWGCRKLNRCPMVHLHRMRVPVLSTTHGVFTKYDYCAPYRPLWMKWLSFPYAWAAKMQQVAACEAEIAVSKNDYRNLISWYWPVRSKFQQLYHSKLLAEPAPPIAGRQPTIIYVGSFGARKGQQFLAKAFANIAERYPEWRLILAGRNCAPDIYSEVLEIRRQHNLQERILVELDISDESVAELMRNSAIFAMPSLHEGLGLSLQEALYRGMACVGSNVGGIPELIEHEVNGLLVEPGNVDELAGALDRMICDERLRKRFSAQARASVLAKGMTAPQMVENYNTIYHKILASRA